MLYRLLADAVVIAHLGFVLFAVLGGLLVLRWKWGAWVHIPTVLWAAFVEFTGWVCPLTPLENWLRAQGEASAYHTGFLDHYVLPVLYPPGLTRELQIGLGVFVLMVNLGIYGWVVWRTQYQAASCVLARRSIICGKRKEKFHARSC
jgi:hypothetical protein